MKRFPILLSLLLVAALLIGLVASCSSEPAQTTNLGTTTPATSNTQTVVIRFASPYPSEDDIGMNMGYLADAFNAKMTTLGAKYKIEMHYAESLVKFAESLDAVRTGAVEMAGFPLGPFSSFDQAFNAAEMPFMYNTVEADAAAQAKLLPYYSQVMEKKFNQKAISGWTVLGLEMCSTTPVKTLADWQGLLVQSISPQNASFVKALGGAPVSMSFTEAYQAIQKKTVSATMQATSAVMTYKLYEIAKYETLGYLQPASAIVSINLDVYNKMPQNVKDALVQAGQEAMDAANKKMISRYESNIPALEGKGMEVYNLPKAEREIWKAKVQPTVDADIAKMGDFGTAFKQVAEEVNTNYPYPY